MSLHKFGFIKFISPGLMACIGIGVIYGLAVGIHDGATANAQPISGNVEAKSTSTNANPQRQLW